MRPDKNETVKVLENYKNLNYDLTQPMRIDFFIEGSPTGLKKVCRELADIGDKFDTVIEHDEDFDVWTCYCSINLMPEPDVVWQMEQLLDSVAQKYACSYEGFGSFGNTVP